MAISQLNTTQVVLSTSYEGTYQEEYNDEEHHLQYLIDISMTIKYYAIPCVWVFGVIGNALAITIFSRKSMRSSLTGYLFLWLAIFDMLSISNGIFDFINLFEINSFPFNNVTCKIIPFLRNSFTSVAAYVLVGITIERLIGISMPHKAKQFCTIHNGKIYISVLIPVCFAIHLPVVVSFGVTTDENETFCDHLYNISLKHFMLFIFPWIRALSYQIMPFCIMFVCNIVIISKLIRSAKDRTQSFSTSSDGPNITSLTAMLIGVSGAFLICTAPTFVTSILDIVDQFTLIADNYGFYLEILLLISDILLVVNHSINFYIYVLTGSRFRKELVVVCGYICLRH